MNIIILGGDGYLGWPTAMNLSNQGNKVLVIDDYSRRNIAKKTSCEPLINAPDLKGRTELFKNLTNNKISYEIGDCSDFDFMVSIFKKNKPDAVIHYAEQPSAPYSMRGFHEAKYTLNNNLNSTFNLLWCVLEHCPDCHIIKLGTMGEYGTPNIDIEEGWIDINHKGRKDKFLFPRQSGSLYHTTKILDTDLIWFYVRTYGLKVTDLMQGPVYGLITNESLDNDQLLPNFHYDSIFGTVVNRFLTQAVAGVPLTVYGKGGQTRGYLNLVDTMKCINIALKTAPIKGNLRILNQFTEQFTVNEIAFLVKQAASLLNIEVKIKNIKNPRKEMEEHYYNASNKSFLDLGLKPTKMTKERLAEMMKIIIKYKTKINLEKIMPNLYWN